MKINSFGANINVNLASKWPGTNAQSHQAKLITLSVTLVFWATQLETNRFIVAAAFCLTFCSSFVRKASGKVAPVGSTNESFWGSRKMPQKLRNVNAITGNYAFDPFLGDERAKDVDFFVAWSRCVAHRKSKYFPTFFTCDSRNINLKKNCQI